MVWMVLTGTLAPLLGEAGPAPCAFRAASFNEMSPRECHSNSLAISGATVGSVAMTFLPSRPVTLRWPSGHLVGQDALLGLLLHPFARFLGQVVDEYRAQDQGG